MSNRNVLLKELNEMLTAGENCFIVYLDNKFYLIRQKVLSEITESQAGELLTPETNIICFNQSPQWDRETYKFIEPDPATIPAIFKDRAIQFVIIDSPETGLTYLRLRTKGEPFYIETLPIKPGQPAIWEAEYE
jgi:hypothetical protein